MRKSLSLATIAMASLFILAGCNSGPSLVGKWDVSGGQMPGKVVQEFKGDGTTTTSIEADAMGQKITMKLTGTYKLDKDQLTMTGTDYTVEGVPPAVMQPMRAQLDKEFKKTETNKITWVSPDEVTLPTAAGPTVTMKRIKS
jgi:hypothetical protein